MLAQYYVLSFCVHLFVGLSHSGIVLNMAKCNITQTRPHDSPRHRYADAKDDENL